MILLILNSFSLKSSFVLQDITDREINKPNQITLSSMVKRSPSDPMTVKYTNCDNLKILIHSKLVPLKYLAYFQVKLHWIEKKEISWTQDIKCSIQLRRFAAGQPR